MVTIDQLKQWDADRLGRVADELHDRRSALTDLADEVTAGRPPELLGRRCVGVRRAGPRQAGQPAHRPGRRAQHGHLRASTRRAAPSAAPAPCSTTRSSRASSNGCTVSADGSVREHRAPSTDEDERDDAQRGRRPDRPGRRRRPEQGRRRRRRPRRVPAVRERQRRRRLRRPRRPDAARRAARQDHRRSRSTTCSPTPTSRTSLVPSLPGVAARRRSAQGLSDLRGQRGQRRRLRPRPGARSTGCPRCSTPTAPTPTSPRRCTTTSAPTARSPRSAASRATCYVGGGGGPGQAPPARRRPAPHPRDRVAATRSFDSRTFGEDLTHATRRTSSTTTSATPSRTATPHYSGNGASILTYLMGDHRLDGDLVEGAAERARPLRAATLGQDGAQAWYSHSGQSMLTTEEHGAGTTTRWPPRSATSATTPRTPTASSPTTPTGRTSTSTTATGRPTASQGITQLAEGVGTDPDLLEQHPEETAGIVSHVLHGIATNDSFSVDNAEAGLAAPGRAHEALHAGGRQRAAGPDRRDRTRRAGRCRTSTSATFKDSPIAPQGRPRRPHAGRGQHRRRGDQHRGGHRRLPAGADQQRRRRPRGRPGQPAEDQRAAQRPARTPPACAASPSTPSARSRSPTPRTTTPGSRPSPTSSARPPGWCRCPAPGSPATLLSAAWDHGVDLGTGALTDAYGITRPTR